MKDNDKDEYFQYTELNKITEKSKQEVDKINKNKRMEYYG